MTDTATPAPDLKPPDEASRYVRFFNLLANLREHLAAAERVAQEIGNSEFAVFNRLPMWMAIEQMRGGMLQALRGWNLANYFRDEYTRELEKEVAHGQKSHRDNSGRTDAPDAKERRHGLLDRFTRRGRRKG